MASGEVEGEDARVITDGWFRPMQIPSPVTHVWAGRKFHFSDVRLNRGTTNYTVVLPGQSVEISLKYRTEWGYNSSDYCPGCVVQLYYGMGAGSLKGDGGFSTGVVKSGISTMRNKCHSSTRFTAPKEPGVYYITWAISLDYHYVTKTHSNDFEKSIAAIHVLQKTDWSKQLLWPLVNTTTRCAVLAFVLSFRREEDSLQVSTAQLLAG